MSLSDASTWRIITSGARKRRRGSAALAAMIALAVVFIVVIGMLAIGQGAFLSGNRQAKLNGSYALASAGVEYGYWQVVDNNLPMPYITTRSLGDGTISLKVTDNGSNTIKVVSTGAYKGDSRTVTRIMAASGTVDSVFNYALCTNSTLSTNQTLTTGLSLKGDSIFANGSISLPNLFTRVTGDARATGSVSVFLCLGKKQGGQNPLSFPPLDLAYYQSIANLAFNTSQTWPFIVFPWPNTVIYVNGDITLTGGSVYGTGTIVASNRIIFAGNLSYNMPGTDKLAGLALNGFSCATPVSVVGIYYGHNSSNSATLTATKSFTISQGSMAVDKVSFSNSSAFSYDWGFTPSLGTQLHLPGY